MLSISSSPSYWVNPSGAAGLLSKVKYTFAAEILNDFRSTPSLSVYFPVWIRPSTVTICPLLTWLHTSSAVLPQTVQSMKSVGRSPDLSLKSRSTAREKFVRALPLSVCLSFIRSPPRRRNHVQRPSGVLYPGGGHWERPGEARSEQLQPPRCCRHNRQSHHH